MARKDDDGRPGYGEARDALLDAAAHVVARHGFAGLTYRAVAEEAGITHTLVAYHFGSRDNLIHEAMAKAVRDAVQRSALNPPSHKLEDFALGLPRLATEEPDAQAFQFELLLEARRRKELLPEAQAMYDEYIRVIREALTEFGVSDDPVMARVAFATLDGIMLQQLLYERSDETEEAVRAFISVLELVRDSRPPKRSASRQKAPRGTQR